MWKLDRLGRSLGYLIELIDHLGKQGAHFHAIQDGINTSTSGGKLVFHIMGALAEFERDIISERTKAGMEAARKRGKSLGPPLALSDEQLKYYFSHNLSAGHSPKCFEAGYCQVKEALRKLA